jgi:hypothetical protein
MHSTNSSNSILAKLLATENITVQHQPGIKTAMFDLKNRVLMLPVWQEITENLKHLLIGHETGHAIDTPTAEEYKAAYEGIAKRVFGDETTSRLTRTVAGFLNVIEDARIDKRQKRRYPGLRKDYLLGYQELIDRDFFGTKGRDINSMNFIDRMNIYFKGGNIHDNIEFTPAEKAFLKRVENLELFDETIILTEEVYRFCKDQIENDMHIDIGIGEPEEGESDDDGFDWDGDSDGAGDFDSDEGSESDSDEGEGEGENESDDEGGLTRGSGDLGANSSGKSNASSHGSDGAGDTSVTAPESETDRVWEQKREELVRDSNADYIYLNMPEFNYAQNVHDYKKVLNDWRSELAIGKASYSRSLKQEAYDFARREMMEWKAKEKDTISFLVKEFEQRKSAEIYSRISIAKTGVINTNKLHSYRYNDDIFRRLTVIPEGKNHGFVMFLDWSGSMDYNLKHTLKQLFTLVLFCKQIQVPFEVYAFKDSDDSGKPSPWNHGSAENSVNFGYLTIRQFLSSKMNIAELNDAMSFLWAMGHGYRLNSDPLSGTPLNEAIFVAPKIVNDFRAKYKLEVVNTIILTDGESNGSMGLVNDTVPHQSYSLTGGMRKRYFFYNDKETGKTVEYDPHGWGQAGQSNTNVLLRLLKEKTGCNLIGFFLFGESWRTFTYRFNLTGNYEYLQKVTKFWKENKFYPVKSEGYDDYFVIDTRALAVTDNNLEIDTSKSTKQMAKAFSKFASKKAVNRVLLRNFIDHVTGKAKKVA